jgi:glutathione S-transferase
MTPPPLQLIGMLDSPYVRRVAISLWVLGLPFEHRPLSVFRDAEAFRSINPVLKAPSAVAEGGVVLMDSTLILQYAEALARPRSLLPSDPATLARDLRTIGLALAACEKCAQIVYERALRPVEKRHPPWVQRVTGQLLAACAGLEAAIGARAPLRPDTTLDQATISAAVAWRFTQEAMPDIVAAADCPRLVALSSAAEDLPAFLAVPYAEDKTVAPTAPPQSGACRS